MTNAVRPGAPAAYALLASDLNRSVGQESAGKLTNIGKKGDSASKQVSITVESATAEALRAVSEKHSLVRDAFLNRLIALLRSSDTLLDCGWTSRRKAPVRGGTAPAPCRQTYAIEATSMFGQAEPPL